jgi:hypothetical protein
MGLFTSDLYRSFAAGFALGAALLFASLGDSQRAEFAARVIPSALAAPAE